MRNRSLQRRLWIGIPAAVVVIALLGFVVVTAIGKLGNEPTPLKSYETSRAFVTKPALELTDNEKRFIAYVAANAPAYNCVDDRNLGTTWFDGLTVCPLYVASITMRGDKAWETPEVTKAMDATGKVLIDISYRHVGEWRLNSDTNQNEFREYWIVTVTCDPAIFPAGSNMRYSQNVRGHEGTWTGPVAVGECNNSQPVTATSTAAIEVYGADPTLKQKGNPLATEKYGK